MENIFIFASFYPLYYFFFFRTENLDIIWITVIPETEKYMATGFMDWRLQLIKTDKGERGSC